ncbi:MAG: hypothetical protein A4E71_00134 [Smithella sp. PtaU1.Bin162]|nr:MAG: hypothetical protein A4E71_00134 [Smithella sp. PtaU1.Bin162]
MEVASNIKINAATCSRIMAVLVEKGYIDKVSRNLGYVPGPALFSLNIYHSPYSQIIKASEDSIRNLAIKTQSLVNISVMKNSYRYILYYYTGNPYMDTAAIEIRNQYPYASATGLLLLSASSKKEIGSIIDKWGVPERYNDRPMEKESFGEELKKIASQELINFKQDDVWVLGGLIKTELYPPLAIGFAIDSEKKLEESVLLLKGTISEIKEKLTFNKKSVLY